MKEIRVEHERKGYLSSIDIIFVINFHALYNQYNKKLVVCGPAFKFETNIDITADEEYTSI